MRISDWSSDVCSSDLERFAPSVAGGGRFHQARVQRVLHVAAQDAVFDQHVALRGIAFVVDVQRTAAVGQRAVVDDGNALGGDRSEEHTSELQSLMRISYAVFCLKKKKNKNKTIKN